MANTKKKTVKADKEESTVKEPVVDRLQPDVRNMTGHVWQTRAGMTGFLLPRMAGIMIPGQSIPYSGTACGKQEYHTAAGETVPVSMTFATHLRSTACRNGRLPARILPLHCHGCRHIWDTMIFRQLNSTCV